MPILPMDYDSQQLEIKKFKDSLRSDSRFVKACRQAYEKYSLAGAGISFDSFLNDQIDTKWSYYHSTYFNEARPVRGQSLKYNSEADYADSLIDWSANQEQQIYLDRLKTQHEQYNQALDYQNSLGLGADNMSMHDDAYYINQQNIAFQEKTNKENQDYAQALTQASWERDDNAHQREVADLVKAGLSPLAALGGAPNASPITSMKIAPQFDINSIVNQQIAKMQESMENKKLALEKERQDRDFSIKSRQLQLESEQLADTIRNTDIKDKSLKQDLLKFTKELDFKNSQLEFQKNQFEENLSFDKEKYSADYRAKEIERQLPLPNCAYEQYDNYNDYYESMYTWSLKFKNYLNSASYKNSKSFGISTDKGGFSASNSYSEKERMALYQWLAENPVPVFVRPYDSLGDF